MHYQTLQGGISSEEFPFIKSQDPQRLYQVFIHSLLPYSSDGKLIKYVR